MKGSGVSARVWLDLRSDLRLATDERLTWQAGEGNVNDGATATVKTTGRQDKQRTFIARQRTTTRTQKEVSKVRKRKEQLN